VLSGTSPLRKLIRDGGDGWGASETLGSKDMSHLFAGSTHNPPLHPLLMFPIASKLSTKRTFCHYLLTQHFLLSHYLL